MDTPKVKTKEEIEKDRKSKEPRFWFHSCFDSKRHRKEYQKKNIKYKERLFA